jgi:hypothetical protein
METHHIDDDSRITKPQARSKPEAALLYSRLHQAYSDLSVEDAILIHFGCALVRDKTQDDQILLDYNKRKKGAGKEGDAHGVGDQPNFV